MNCENNINDCTPSSCQNNGVCVDGINGFTCNCAGTGFGGNFCETNVNDCLSNLCVNGNCVDGVNQ